MGIPKNFGMSKISHMRGEEENRYGGREGSHSSSRAGQQRDYMASGPLSFELDNASDAVALLQRPSFNMLYVSTPKIALLQTPTFRAIADLWSETVDLVKPVLRFGFPETSLKTKCPYYDDKLYASDSGALLPMDRTRVLIKGIQSGLLTGAHHSSHHHSAGSSSKHTQQQEQELSESSQGSLQTQQRQPGQSVGMFGISTVAFLAGQVMGAIKQQKQQQQEQRHLAEQRATGELLRAEQQSQAAIPKGRFLVPDIPSGTLVLALNLMAYWAITNQSRRSSMGGAMPQ